MADWFQAPRPALWRIEDVACVAAFIIVAGAVIHVRTAMAYTFPLPWPDETAFLSQAEAFSATGSFFAPGLSPDRIIMWMPQGYMVIMAGLFRILGYSYGLARDFSAVCLILSCSCILLAQRRIMTGWIQIVCAAACVLAFLAPYTLVDGNVARMDGLLVLLMVVSMLFGMNGRWLSAVSCVLLAATVHFNAVYFTAPCGAAISICFLHRKLPVIRWLDVALAALALAAFAAYVIFCAFHKAGFINDMRAQFAIKASHPFIGGWQGITLQVSLVLLAAAVTLRDRDVSPSATIAWFAASFFFMALYGQEMWYRVGFMLGLLLAFSVVMTWIGQTSLWTVRIGLLLGAATLACYENAYGYTLTPATAPMTTLAHFRVIGKTDAKRIRSFINSLPPGQTVSFGDRMNGIESFFLGDLRRAGARWITPAYSVIDFGAPRSPDWRVHCDSSLYSPMINPATDGSYPRLSRDTGCDIIPLSPSAQAIARGK